MSAKWQCDHCELINSTSSCTACFRDKKIKINSKPQSIQTPQQPTAEDFSIVTEAFCKKICDFQAECLEKIIFLIKLFVNNDHEKTKYKLWNLEKILLWIDVLENGRFQTYSAQLRIAFKEQHVDASNLSSMSEGVLLSFGVRYDVSCALSLHFKKLARMRMISDEEYREYEYLKEVRPMLFTAAQTFARNPSKSISTSTRSRSSSLGAIKSGSETDKCRANARKFAFGKYYTNLYDQFDGASMKKCAIGRNDAEYITTAHIVSPKALNNDVLLGRLNDGFSERFDAHSKRNLLFIKNEYSAALESHQLAIIWESGTYKIMVREPTNSKFKHLHGESVKFYEDGSLVTEPQFPPYRRACAMSYLSMCNQLNQIYNVMKTISQND